MRLSPPACRRLPAPGRLFLIWTLLALGALAGSSDHRIEIDAIHNPHPAGRALFAYKIAPAALSDEERPAYRDAVQLIKTALSGCGLYEAPEGVIPELTIEVDCGVTAPRTETRTRTETVVPPPKIGELLGTKPITYVTTDYRVTVCFKYLMVTARPRGSQANLWRVQAALNDASTELDPCLPLLAAAVMNHVGQDTRGTRTMTLSHQDPDVAFINQGMP
jgi:hypothetical protein